MEKYTKKHWHMCSMLCTLFVEAWYLTMGNYSVFHKEQAPNVRGLYFNNFTTGGKKYCTCLDLVYSLLHMMHAITCAHASTCATSLMHVKNSMCHFCLWYLFFRTLV